MSDGALPGKEPPTASVSPTKVNRRTWQIGLRTLVLAMAAIAVWIAVFVNLRQNSVLHERIRGMQMIARELVIRDNQRIAVVSLEQEWSDQNAWELWVPRHHEYRLCVATRQIDQAGFPSDFNCKPLKTGRHRIVLKKQRSDEGWKVSVWTDDSVLLTVDEPREWGDVSRTMGGDEFSISVQLSADQPVVLFRRQFLADDAPGGVLNLTDPTNGVQLWLEPVSLK